MEIIITKDNGEIVSRQYLRARVSAGLSKLRRLYPINKRRKAIAETVDCDRWLQRRNGQTVGSIIRAVESTI